MYTASSSHKRRRPSARADAARRRLPGRVVLNIAGFHNHDPEGEIHLDTSSRTTKGKGKAGTDAFTERRIQEVIASHCFNHRFTLTLPESSTASTPLNPTSSPSFQGLLEHLSHLFSSCRSYHVQTSLTLFLNQRFLNSYIRSPSNMIALSVGQLDVDDIVCLTGDGQLILHVTKDTYQTLGLQGRPAHFNRGSSGRMGERTSGGPTRYLISIPLLDPTFVPGKPGFERVVECFERWESQRGSGDRKAGKFNLLLASASMKAIRFPPTVVEIGEVDCFRTKVDQAFREDIWIPDMNAREGVGSLALGWKEETKKGGAKCQDVLWTEWAQTCEDLVGWTKMLSRDAEGIKTYYRPSELPISSYEAPEPHYPGKVHLFNVQGFLHPEVIQKASKLVRDWVDNIAAGSRDGFQETMCDSKQPLSRTSTRWAYLCVTGFASSPVRWRSHDPGWGLGLGQGRSYEDGIEASRSQGMGKGGKGIFDIQRGSTGMMNRLKRFNDKVGEDADLLEGEDDANGMETDCEEEDEESSGDEEEDFSWQGSSDSDLQKSSKSMPRTGKSARRKRAKLVKRRGHLRKGHSEREGGVGGSCSEQGWGMILFGIGDQTQRNERQEGADVKGIVRQQSRPRAKVIWWENVEGDTRS